MKKPMKIMNVTLPILFIISVLVVFTLISADISPLKFNKNQEISHHSTITSFTQKNHNVNIQSTAPTQTTEISISSINIPVAGSGISCVNLSDVDVDAGSCEYYLSFNPSVVTVDTLISDDSDFDWVDGSFNNTAGTIHVYAIDFDGVSGSSLNVACIQFNASPGAVAGDSCPLIFTDSLLADATPAGNPIDHSIENGTAMILNNNNGGEPTVLSIADANIPVAGSGISCVNLSDVDVDAGSCEYYLSFNPSVVTVDTLISDDSDFDWVDGSFNNTAGTIHVYAIDFDGVSGSSLNVACIQFNASPGAVAGDSCPLIFTDSLLADATPAGNPIDHSIENGTITITENDSTNITVVKSVKINCNTPYTDEGYVINLTDPHWVTFKISVEINGSFETLSVKDMLPNGLIFNESWSITHGWPLPEICPGDGSLYWNFSTIENCSETIYFRADIEEGFCGNITNSVTVLGQNDGTNDVITNDTVWVNVICDGENPAIHLVKDSDVSVASVGDTITYTYVVSNIGDVTLFNVSVFDVSLSTYVTLDDDELEPAESTSGVLTYVVKNSDLPGPLVNFATASGTSLLNTTVYDNDAASVKLIGCGENPAIHLVKDSDVSVAFVGDTITYTYVVSNIGDVTLFNVSVFDVSLSTYVTLDDDELEPAESTSGVLTYVVKNSDLPGPLVNFATASGTSLLNTTVYDNDAASVKLIGCGENPAIHLVKDSDVSVAFVGDTITYTYVVSNIGDVTLFNVSVFDVSLSTYVTLDDDELEPAESTSGVLTYVVKNSDLPGPLVNFATASGTSLLNTTVYDNDTASVDLTEDCDITIVKTVKEDCCGEYGKNISVNYSDFVIYKLDIYMNCSTNVMSLHVRDNLPQLMGLEYNESCMYVLDDDENYVAPSLYNHTITSEYLFWNFTFFPAETHYTIFYKADAVSCGPYENTVNLTAHVRPCCPSVIYDNDTAVVNVICPSGIWVEKDVSLDGIHWQPDSVEAVVGDTVWFRITVDNLYLDEPVYAVNVTDHLPDHIVFDGFVTTDNASNITMGPHWWQIFYHYIMDEKIIIFKGTVINVGYDCNEVVVSSCEENSVTDDACVNVSDGMRLNKQVSTDNQTWMKNVSVVAGERVYWNVSIHFASADQNLSLVEIMITDTLPEGLTYVDDTAMVLKSNGWSMSIEPVEDDGELIWNLTMISDAWLRNGSWLAVLFATDVTDDINGTLVNRANVTALQCDNTTVFDEDTATIFVEESLNHPPRLTDPVPADDAVNVSIDVNLRINVSDGDDDRLTVTFYNASDDHEIDSFTNINPPTTVTAPWDDLEYNTTYQWYVTANDGNITKTSSVYTFTTEKKPDNRPPNSPDDESPTDNANGISLSPTLSVHVSDPDGDSLTVEFYDADTDLLISTDTCTSDCTASITWNGLQYETTYQWYVIVSDTEGLEVTSSTWSFTTRSADVTLDVDITGGIGVNAEIMNLGSDDALDVSWSIQVKNNGLFTRINKSDSGVIDLIESGGDVVAKKLAVSGIARITITVTADCDQTAESVVKTKQALLLGPMVFIQ